jgi:HEAT repeat protein
VGKDGSPERKKTLSTIPSEDLEGLIAEIAGVLLDKDESLRIEAANLLEWLGAGAGSAVPQLIEAMAYVQTEHCCSEALGSIGVKAIGLLLRGLRDPRKRVRRGCASALGKIAWRTVDGTRLEPAVDDLIVMLSEPDAGCRETAVWVLTNFLEQIKDPRLQRRIRRAILDRIEDHSPSVRYAVVGRAASGVFGKDWVFPALIAGLKDSSVEVRESTLRDVALLGVKAKSLSPLVITMVRRKALPRQLRVTAVSTLVEIAPQSPETVSVLRAIARDSTDTVRQIAAEALTRVHE